MVDFLGIGAQKGGTSWLYENLARHPDVWFPFLKEVHFFDQRFLNAQALQRARKTGDLKKFSIVRKIRRQIRKLRDEKRENDYNRNSTLKYFKRLIDPDFFMTEEWYDFLFSPAPPSKKTGEITPYYCAIGEAGIVELKRRFPAVKLIYLIRDPVDRALSCLRMVGQRSKLDMTNPLVLARLANRCLKSEGFYRRGDFRSHIPLWDRHFGDQVLYIPFGLIKSEPQEVFRRLESFLGISPFEGYPLLDQPVHATIRSQPMPEEIRGRFAEVNLEQYRFLEARFAYEFVNNLR